MPNCCVVCEVKFMGMNPHKYFAKSAIMTVVQSFTITVPNRLLNTRVNICFQGFHKILCPIECSGERKHSSEIQGPIKVPVLYKK